MSNLRAKLNSMKTASARPEVKARSGLKILRYEESADDALYNIESQALFRMGFGSNATLHTPHSTLNIEDLLFIDTETTGLSGGVGTVAFLTGIGYVKNGRFYVEQYLMRDYADEPQMLEQIALRMSAYRTVVTFNGKSFDMPLLKGRFTLLRMQSVYREPENLDLLFPSRRLWKRRLENCKLSTLEDRILGRGREGDLPGSEVPQRFFNYLKTGDETLLDDVVVHNRLDIVSLGALLVALANAYASPLKQMEAADLFSMGRVLQKLGEHEEAEICYEQAARPCSVTSIRTLKDSRYTVEAQKALSLLYKRRGDYQKAVSLWRKMAKRGQFACWANIELSKYYEHRLGDYREAMNAASDALKLVAGENAEQVQIRRRIDRLAKKMEG